MYLISDNIDTCTGMRLAGVEGAVVHDKQGFLAEVEKVLADKSVGILMLTENFGQDYPEEVNKLKLDVKIPLVVEVPDRHGTGRKSDFITAYVSEAIGIKL